MADVGSWILAGTTIVFIVFLFIFGRGGSNGKRRQVDIRTRQFVSPDNDRGTQQPRGAGEEGLWHPIPSRLTQILTHMHFRDKKTLKSNKL